MNISNNPIFKLFARSPIHPLVEHMRCVHECTATLEAFFSATFNENWDQARDLQGQISKLENDADDLKRDIRIHLPNGLFMPVPRSDLLDLLTMQDKIANKAKEIAGIVLGRQLAIPKNLQSYFLQFLKECIATSSQAMNAVSELDTLLETGFRGREVQLVEGMIHELDKLEDQTDKTQVELRKQLFAIEKDFSPIDIMFVYRIIEAIGELADRAQNAGGQLQLLLAR
jgi:predicted phosphate transport protein (TIGR00153 family)